MQLLGVIRQLQIQRDCLKVGQSPNRVYTTAPLLQVAQLKITARGIFGFDAPAHVLVDVHHLDHPNTRNRDNKNGLSLNFTGHYERIRARFGPHMRDGLAGENILIENAGHLLPQDLGGRIAIKSASAGQIIYLDNAHPALPCAEFSTYAAQKALSGTEMKAALQFLDEGMRGFYLTLAAGQQASVIGLEDEVYAGI